LHVPLWKYCRRAQLAPGTTRLSGAARNPIVDNAHNAPAAGAMKGNSPGGGREQRVVAAPAHILSGVPMSSALPDDYRSRLDHLPAMHLDAQALGR
jgi:hypothetical protein